MDNIRKTFRLSSYLGSTTKLLEAIKALRLPATVSYIAQIESCGSRAKPFVELDPYVGYTYSDLVLNIDSCYPVTYDNLIKQKSLQQQQYEHNKKSREHYKVKKEQEKMEYEAVLASLSDKIKATLFE